MWGDTRTLQALTSNTLFIAARYECCRCVAKTRSNRATKKLRSFRFCASSPGALGLMSSVAKATWAQHVVDEHVLCDRSLVDAIRASATRMSYEAIAAMVNELRATHAARLGRKYIAVCMELGLEPVVVDKSPYTHTLHRRRSGASTQRTSRQGGRRFTGSCWP